MPNVVVGVRAGSFAILAVGIAAVAGCTPPPAPCFPVAGKVTMKSKPVTVGSVTFTPDASKGNNLKDSPFGVIGPDGTYTLKTGDRDGAPVGWYKVSINPMVPPGEGEAPAKALPKATVPAKYMKTDTSGISIEVTETPKPGAYDIDLK
jgi:hypothetical protein